MSTAAVSLDTTQYVRINIGRNPMIVQSHRDSVRIAYSDAQPVVSNISFHTLSGDTPPLVIPANDTNVWALAMTESSGLTVTEFDLSKVPVSSDAVVPKTAFGDARIAELNPIFQQSFEYTVDNSELTTNTVTNGGTVTQANAMAVIGSSVTTNSTARMSSYTGAKYNAGLGALLRFTAKFTSPVVGTEQYCGLMDAVGSSEAFNNGYSIGYNGTVFGFHRWVNDTLVTVPQSSWDDPLDGTGPSGMTLDHTNLNVFEIRFQFLGAGAIELFVEDDSTGGFVSVHKILYANLNTTPSVENPNFCAMFWVNNGATTSDIVLSTSSFGYFIEGKSEYSHTHRPQFSSGIQQATSVATEIPVFTIRNKSTYASVTNFTDLLLEFLTAANDANQANTLTTVRLLRDVSLTGASFSDINTNDSVVEIDTSATSFTGGRELLPVLLSGQNDKDKLKLNDLKIIVRPGQAITVAASSSNSATVDASLFWRELF